MSSIRYFSSIVRVEPECNAELSGASQLNLRVNRCSQMKADISGASVANIKPSNKSTAIGDLDMEISGAAKASMSAVEVMNAKFDISDASKVETYVTGKMTINISGNHLCFIMASLC